MKKISLVAIFLLSVLANAEEYDFGRILGERIVAINNEIQVARRTLGAPVTSYSVGKILFYLSDRFSQALDYPISSTRNPINIWWSTRDTQGNSYSEILEKEAKLAEVAFTSYQSLKHQKMRSGDTQNLGEVDKKRGEAIAKIKSLLKVVDNIAVSATKVDPKFANAPAVFGDSSRTYQSFSIVELKLALQLSVELLELEKLD